MKKQQISLLVVFVFVLSSMGMSNLYSYNLPDPYYSTSIVKAKHHRQDTVPVKDRPYDFTNPYNKNPFDLKDPGSIDKGIEYDQKTGRYLINEKVGTEYYRMPSYMTFDEYLKWRAKKQEQEYFQKLSGVSSSKKEKNDPLAKLSSNDPLKKFDLKNQLIDRLFGGTTVSIQPQGNIDLTFGGFYQRTQNPVFPINSQRQAGFDFDMNIRMNVTGKIGEKLNISTNYNTQATFDFENQMKLNYDSKNFSEDAIVQKIEAGNVSLPLKGQLIQGAQSLFGVKTELQFGYLRLTGIASQQKSQRQNIKLQGGGQYQTFRLTADQYDENRHFFLSHLNRQIFEPALKNLPLINTQIKINRLEVWVTNDRNATEEVRDIIALADLGEPDPNQFMGQTFKPKANPDLTIDPCKPEYLPDNNINDLYKNILASPGARQLSNVVNTLQDSTFKYKVGFEFEKIRARKLNPSEYTYHEDLGFISLNVNLRPNQVLAVAYEYTFGGQYVKRVGEFGIDAPGNTDTLGVLFVKLLKSQITRVKQPIWNLMMKNVYSTGALNANREDFRLDVFYQDAANGNIEKRFMPDDANTPLPLLNLFGLDKLNVQGDPNPDGVFDYVPGVTIQPKNGRIIFPLLEPFGRSLPLDTAAKTKYNYDSLYTNTVTAAREIAEQNRFVIKGQYKSSASSDVSLGGFNIPKGSVRVTAGSNVLAEGRDYEVDYTTGKVRIINEAYSSSGVPVNISYEDNTLFNFQTKTLLGARADYSLGKQLGIGDLNIGATYLHLFERPFTQKVNIGDDPINNRIYGLDAQYNADAPWLTRIIDKLPLISTKQPSSITVFAEGAVLQPGHASAINQSQADSDGALYIDDFEGSSSGYDLRTPPQQWALASVPRGMKNLDLTERFSESKLVNNRISGYNRALINWYRIDNQIVNSGSGNIDPYEEQIDQALLFKNTFFQPGVNTLLQPFDISYYPTTRGPYNFETLKPTAYSAGLDGNGLLREPKTRWGGIMRALSTTDFEQANIEYLEFWMLSPFLDAENLNAKGNFHIHLGSISEDILPDSRTSFENALPTQINNLLRTDTTRFARIPRIPPVTNAFDIDTTSRRLQDVGFDGMDDDGERELYRDYLNTLRAEGILPNALTQIEDDPSNDNFVHFQDATNTSSAKARYRKYNNPQGNSKATTGLTLQAATNLPDIEDLNKDNSLNEAENYFSYSIPMEGNGSGGMIKTDFITDTILYRNPNGDARVWYRFRIPLNGVNRETVGDITDFRSIQFIRLVLTDFENPVTLRFARFELGRNQWRRYQNKLSDIDRQPDILGTKELEFDLNRVNIEENSGRTPFSYVLPTGIRRQRNLSSFNQDGLQNEQSLSLRLKFGGRNQAASIYRLTNLDLRLYNRLKMFTHAEEYFVTDGQPKLQDGDLSVFVRMGSDFNENYYEYELPLYPSRQIMLPNDNTSESYSREIWRDSNNFDFKLALFREIKEKRNADKTATLNQVYNVGVDPEHPTAKVKVKGNPNLGAIKTVMIGVINNTTEARYAEVWVNELRVTGLDEQGGYAGMARADFKMADLGTLTLSGNYSSIGWGGLDQRLMQRARESTKQYDITTNLELSKFTPAKWGLKIPFYIQYSNTLKTPEYDPYDLDIKLKDKLAKISDQTVKDSILSQVVTRTTVKGYSFTNVRKDRVGRGAATPMPWNIENFSFTYSDNTIQKNDPIIQNDQTRTRKGLLDYTYASQVKYWTPFKKLIKKDKYLKFLSEFNINPLPNSFTANTSLERVFQQTTYRFAGEDPQRNTYYNKRFNWRRDYNLNWDFTKQLKFTFTANNLSVIDERPEFLEDNGVYRRLTDAERREDINNGLRKFGRTKNYGHNANLNYTLPFKLIPLMDWVNVRAQYATTYSWNAATLQIMDSLGNVIQNTQNYQINGEFNLESLYNQWGYLAKINGQKTPQGQKRGATVSAGRSTGKETKQEVPAEKNAAIAKESAKDAKKNKKKEAKKKESEYEPTIFEKVLIRPLMTIRKAKITYDEKFGTVLPGFMPQAGILGQQNFTAPGWGFIAGYQPDRAWLDRAAEQNWITRSPFLNQQVVQNHTQSISANLSLEPFQDFRVDVDIKKDYTQNRTEFFKADCDGGFSHNDNTAREIGSFSVTYIALQSHFRDSVGDLIRLFKKFEQNRTIISERLAGPGAAIHEKDAGFKQGYGKFQQDVLAPAFIAAYTGKDARNVELNLFKTMPLPNWRLNYGGLSKLPFLKNYIQNLTITHGYKSTLTVNSFSSDLQYEATNPTKINTITGSYFARLAIPTVVINEQFSPLLGIDLRLKNNLNLRIDMKRTRNLQMSFTDYQMAETKTSEYVVGFGYILKGVKLNFLEFLNRLDPNFKASVKLDKDKKKAKVQTNNPLQPTSNKPVANDLSFKFDFSWRDDVTFNHILDQNIVNPTRGSLTIRISPSIDYALNQKLTLRLFVDYNKTVPKTSNAFPMTSTRGGVTVRFQL